MKQISLYTLLFVFVLIPGVVIPTMPGVKMNIGMTDQSPQIVGEWKKTTDSACSLIYPDTIQFQKNGLYYGNMDTIGTFTQWDAGEFQVLDNTQINISTANDAIVTYRFSIENNILTFKDTTGCVFSFRKLN